MTEPALIPDPHASPERWAPRLEEALARSEAAYAALESLSDEQSVYIERSETENLLGLLARRQRLVDDAASAASALEPFIRAWPELMATVPQRRRDEFGARVSALADSLERIARRDDADRAALERMRTNLTAEIASTSRARGAAAAYSAGVRPAPRYQDREC